MTEIAALSFAGPPPDAAELSRGWHAMLNEARELVSVLPPAEIGGCVLDQGGNLFRGGTTQLLAALTERAVRFHEGRIHGALPQLREGYGNIDRSTE